MSYRINAGYWVLSEIAKINPSKKNQSVLIAKISSRKTQKIANPQKYRSTRYPLEKWSVVWSTRARSLFLVPYLRQFRFIRLPANRLISEKVISCIFLILFVLAFFSVFSSISSFDFVLSTYSNLFLTSECGH